LNDIFIKLLDQQTIAEVPKNKLQLIVWESNFFQKKFPILPLKQMKTKRVRIFTLNADVQFAGLLNFIVGLCLLKIVNFGQRN
tara:strand:+ start:347 stop:595 length:249 start_codon:yes stop_codon:yes gene_type:complete